MQIKKGDKFRWRSKFTRGKPPEYDYLKHERMMYIRRNDTTYPLTLISLNGPHKGQYKAAKLNEIKKID